MLALCSDASVPAVPAVGGHRAFPEAAGGHLRAAVVAGARHPVVAAEAEVQALAGAAGQEAHPVAALALAAQEQGVPVALLLLLWVSAKVVERAPAPV